MNKPIDKVTTVLRVEANLTTGKGLRVHPTPTRFDMDFWSSALAAVYIVMGAELHRALKLKDPEADTPQEEVMRTLQAATNLKIQRLQAQALAATLANQEQGKLN